MRNMKLHTICILALSSILTIGFEAHAQLDPNMEASAGCFDSNCVFAGNSQASDNVRGLSKLPVARLQKVNDYRNNPATPVNFEETPQFAPVGVLERDTHNADGSITRLSGSSVIVSPCYILTNHHVAFGDDMKPIKGKNYEMTFRAGVGDDEGGFYGHTTATPVVWGEMDARGRNDWALMKLSTCVGGFDAFGWVDATNLTQHQMVARQQPVAVVGYSYKNAREQMSVSYGKVRGEDSETEMMQIDASMVKKNSGGAMFTWENGVMKLAGLATLEMLDSKNPNSDTVDQWTADRSNLAQSAYEILNRPEVSALIEADKNGRANPAQERLARPMPRSKTQMAAI